MHIYIKRMGKHALEQPAQESETAAGFDLRTTTDISLYPGITRVIPTGFAWEIPLGHVGLIRDRSSVAKTGLAVVAGVVDSDYRGEVGVVMTNLGNDMCKLEAGSRIAQMIIVPHLLGETYEVDELTHTERGENGYGSTGA